jgi:hypothetical protein
MAYITTMISYMWNGQQTQNQSSSKWDNKFMQVRHNWKNITNDLTIWNANILCQGIGILGNCIKKRTCYSSFALNGDFLTRWCLPFSLGK